MKQYFINDIHNKLIDSVNLLKPYADDKLIESILRNKVNVLIQSIDHYYNSRGYASFDSRNDYIVLLDDDNLLLNKAIKVKIVNIYSNFSLNANVSMGEEEINIILSSNVKLDKKFNLISKARNELFAIVTMDNINNVFLLNKLYDYLETGETDLSLPVNKININ